MLKGARDTSECLKCMALGNSSQVSFDELKKAVYFFGDSQVDLVLAKAAKIYGIALTNNT